MTEVKNVKQLSLTSQVKDFLLFGEKNAYQIILRVRPTTQLSKPLQELVQHGRILLDYIK